MTYEPIQMITIYGKLGLNEQVKGSVLRSLAMSKKTVTEIRDQVRGSLGNGWQVIFKATAGETLGQAFKWVNKIEQLVAKHHVPTPQHPSLRKNFSWHERGSSSDIHLELFP